jgi:hypothetical protein
MNSGVGMTFEVRVVGDRDDALLPDEVVDLGDVLLGLETRSSRWIFSSWIFERTSFTTAFR